MKRTKIGRSLLLAALLALTAMAMLAVAPTASASICLGEDANPPPICDPVDDYEPPPPVDPFGELRGAHYATDNSIWVYGWALDPDATAPIRVDLYADGSYVGTATAAGLMYWTGPARMYGFNVAVPVPWYSTATICARAVNVGPGSDQVIGCVQGPFTLIL
jgi:hypothetical protein